MVSAIGVAAEKNNEGKFIARTRTLHPKPDIDLILPARLGYARDEPLRRQLAEGKPRNLEPANKGAPAPGDFAAVHDAGRAGIARQLGEAGVILLRFQLSAQGGMLLHRRAFAFVAINP